MNDGFELSGEETVIDNAVSTGFELVGSTLAGRYHIERKLGGGGIGDVYLARDKPDLMSRQVVVKVLQEQALSNEWIVTKFRQEIEALTRIDDPGVVGLLDAGNLPNGHPFLVMQFVEGENLRTQMRPDRGMEFEDIAEIVQQVGRTLSVAHANDVIHRDLKPENIMARRRAEGGWQVKVIDFGIAKVRYSLIAPSTIPGQVAGTAYYMSPEQLQGKKVTAASDVYALGIIAYEMVTGRRPFNPETVFQLIEMQQAGVQVAPRALRPALPVRAQNAILKALALDPGDRYQSAAEFANELAAALHDEETVVPPKPSKRVISLTPILILIAIILVAAGGFVLMRFVWVSPERNLTYWLTVQRMYDGKLLGQPFQATGRDYFHTGDSFALSFTTAEPGALYLINEGRDQSGALEWNILFPTRANNAGDARLSAQQTIRTGNYRFVGSTGSETVWVIWATKPDPVLDAIFLTALNDGVIKDPAQQAQLQTFLEEHQSAPAEVVYDEGASRALLKGHGEILVRRLDLSHKPN